MQTRDTEGPPASLEPGHHISRMPSGTLAAAGSRPWWGWTCRSHSCRTSVCDFPTDADLLLDSRGQCFFSRHAFPFSQIQSFPHSTRHFSEKAHRHTRGRGSLPDLSHHLLCSILGRCRRPTVEVTRFYMRIILEETKLLQAAGLHPKGTSLKVGHWWSWRHRRSAGGTLPLREAWAWPLQGPPCP